MRIALFCLSSVLVGLIYMALEAWAEAQGFPAWAFCSLAVLVGVAGVVFFLGTPSRQQRTRGIGLGMSSPRTERTLAKFQGVFMGMTNEEFAQKVEWEGGWLEAIFGYGLSESDLEEQSGPFYEAVKELSSLRKRVGELEATLERLTEDMDLEEY